jgi:hypothetical protein
MASNHTCASPFLDQKVYASDPPDAGWRSAPPAHSSGALAAQPQGVAMTAPIQQLQQLRHHLAVQFPERREVIEGTFYALLCRDHILYLGPPDPMTFCASSPSH